MKLVLVALGSFLIVFTVLSHVRSAHWWIRIADFPRVQIAFALALVSGIFIRYFDPTSARDASFGLARGARRFCRSFRLFPYTRLAPRQVLLALPNVATTKAQQINISAGTSGLGSATLAAVELTRAVPFSGGQGPGG